MKTTAQALREFIRENFLFGQEAAFSDSDSFLEERIIDSSGVLELVAHLESQYGLTVADEELVPGNLDSIDNLVRFIEAKRSSPIDHGRQPQPTLPAAEAGFGIGPGCSCDAGAH